MTGVSFHVATPHRCGCRTSAGGHNAAVSTAAASRSPGCRLFDRFTGYPYRFATRN